MTCPDAGAKALRRTVALVAAMNLAYFLVEIAVALAIDSVARLADSVDFLEDVAVNLLIFVALGWPLARRATAGKTMALLILAPAVAAIWRAVVKFQRPEAPDVYLLGFTAGGAVLVNTGCAWLLSRHRNSGGSLTRAAWLAARNDVAGNLAILVMAAITWGLVPNGWPDLVLGSLILALNLRAAWEVWELSEEEQLAAKALESEAGCCG